MDPIYASLLQHPPVHATPVTAGQQARLLLRAGSSTATALQPVLMPPVLDCRYRRIRTMTVVGIVMTAPVTLSLRHKIPILGRGYQFKNLHTSIQKRIDCGLPKHRLPLGSFCCKEDLPLTRCLSISHQLRFAGAATTPVPHTASWTVPRRNPCHENQELSSRQRRLSSF
jgi:hypothetical protein